ncbi:putative peroxiredoxin bcp [Gammaproteobacteria bacterium]
MLQLGQLAPPFALPDPDMQVVTLDQLLENGPLVLYFYPKDDTPGCTMEGLEFTDLMTRFEAIGATVVGISRDNCVSHGAFRDKYGLTVRLLADVDGQTCLDYGVWREKEVHGEKRAGILRSTFVIGRDGNIRHACYDVKPKGQAEQMLALLANA